MKFRATLPDTPEINLTALIDVVFLLLIFFMVTTTFEWRSELRIELPTASAQEKTNHDAMVAVVIDAAGHVRVDGHQVEGAEAPALRRALVNAARGLDSVQVVVSADARTPHQSVVTVMDAARQVGLYRLTFAARLFEEPAR